MSDLHLVKCVRGLSTLFYVNGYRLHLVEMRNCEIYILGYCYCIIINITVIFTYNKCLVIKCRSIPEYKVLSETIKKLSVEHFISYQCVCVCEDRKSSNSLLMKHNKVEIFNLFCFFPAIMIFFIESAY